MKKITFYLVVFLCFSGSNAAFSQTEDEPEALGLPGDNLNLYAVLDVFQNSKTLEDFEEKLNSDQTNINNLDLNNDDKTDFIRVVSSREDKAHSIVLQVGVNEKENQDVAVINVNTNKEGKVRIQVIGDEELYGENYVVEPSNSPAKGTPNPGYKDAQTVIINNNTTNNTITNNTTSESRYSNSNDALFVANALAIVVHLFSPTYVVYRSPWYWGYYPSYWRPWRPVFYSTYWRRHYHYWNDYRYRRAYRIHYASFYSRYRQHRAYSALVKQNRLRGTYNNIYEGRVYKKPTTYNRPVSNVRPKPYPTTRPSTGVTRPTTPVTRPKPTTPSVQPRPNVPATRPVTRPTTPVTRPKPTTPTVRPRPSTPVTRPVTRPTTRPSASPSRPMPRSQRER